ncbi:MAG: cytochrome c biogenesis protein CcsA [Fimbriimonadaceae bacterium]|nr:cytochrome c biogenesis protein CcsA [Fimbriimonadaceae bacterium]
MHDLHLPLAPGWSLALGGFGRGAVAVGLVAGLLAAVLAWRGRDRAAGWSFAVSVIACAAAFVTLGVLFVQDQFHFRYVFSHGAADHELRYKIAGIWSGQEGSFLLWSLTSGLFALAALRAVGELRRGYLVVVGLVQAALCGILAYESPFALMPLMEGKQFLPPTGQGLPPTLMNYWVTIHPPVIFLGFGSLGVLFAWSVAALASGRLEEWVRPVRPWALVSLSVLGVGLCMGGFWAYETLGWGGFWAWDPVENASLVPWCVVAALVHGVYIQVSRGKGHLATAYLGGLPFLLFGYGTFLTRSGFLGDTSVHSFASMDRSALWILVGLVSVSAVVFHGFFVRAARRWRAENTQPTGPKEKLVGTGQLLLACIGVVTAVGMSVPLIQTLSGQAAKVVEERLYNTVLAFLFVPFLVVMTLAPWVPWRKLAWKDLMGKLANVFAVTIGLVGVTLLFVKGWGGLAAVPDAKSTLLLRYEVPQVPFVIALLAVCYFAVVGNAWRLIEVAIKTKTTVGGLLAHAGVAIALTGLVFSRALEQRQLIALTPIAPAQALGRQWVAKGPTKDFADRNNAVRVEAVSHEGVEEFRPGFYYLSPGEDGQPRPVSWPAVNGRPFYDLYLVVVEMYFEATDPTQMAVGDERALQSAGMLVKYNGLEVEGTPGTPGAVFGAKLTVSFLDGRRLDVKPTFGVASGRKEVVVDEDFSVRLDRIDAADRSAAITLLFRRPAYAAEIFYKPMTILVWWGIGIMGLGGLIAAYQRRFRPSSNVVGHVPIGTENETEPAPESEVAPR